MRAHQTMTRQVITVTADAAIVDAAHKMLQHHISGFPVVNEAGNLIGIVSEGDFMRRKEIGTQKKRGRWLEFFVGPGKTATDFVHEQGRKVENIMTPIPAPSRKIRRSTKLCSSWKRTTSNDFRCCVGVRSSGS